MSIPKYNELMRPLLEAVADGRVYDISDLIEELGRTHKLTEEERKELLPSGQQYKFDNRVGWARTFLKKANLLTSPERGKIQITDRGVDEIRIGPSEFTDNYLRKFPEFREFREFKTKRKTTSQIELTQGNSDKTPEEILEENFAEIQSNLIGELLNRVKNESPKFFEKLVIDLLLKMGYGGSRKDAGSAIGRSHDGGIDGVINEDKLGLDVIYVQAKRWDSNVSRPMVQSFAGALDGVRANRGILITTSEFSKDAHEYVKSIGKKIVLIDGETLANLMIEYNIGVNTISVYQIKRIDSDYFIDD